MLSRLYFLLAFAIIHIITGANAAYAQKPRTLKAIRVENAPEIDGRLTEPVWQDAPFASKFKQSSPSPGKKSSQKSEVKVLYDNVSVYIGARLYDVAKDSILKEITRRDQGGITDMFGVLIDTYDNDQDAFEFFVSAAGVQIDARRTPTDRSVSWNAAWRSEVQIEETDWFVEMEIPFSAIRFPKTDVQSWGINFFRAIRRKNEFSYWNEINPNIDGFVNQFGLLKGIKNVKSPVRLQLSPYISGYVNHHTADGEQPASFSQAVNFGMDVKYGINDAITLDMMLIPDFGQVQSDNQVLNLSPFEVQFDENRQFFTEGTELFNKGGFFYSRRIGGKPIYYNQADDHLAEGEQVVSNPRESSIINASKISGRLNNGLGIGVLNAVTSAMSAEIRTESGESREVQTAPVTNYSVVALDQSLQNNSYVTFINTNVTRGGNAYNANLAGTAFRLANKSNNFAVSGQAAYNIKYGGREYNQESETGYTSSLTLAKIGGNLTYSVTNYIESDTYDPNDLGFLRANNEVRNTARIGYQIFEPFGKFLNFSANISFMHRQLYSPSEFTSFRVNGNFRATLKNFFTNNLSWGFYPGARFDYFEPRVEGRFFERPSTKWLGYWFSTDSRKRVRLAGNISWGDDDFLDAHSLSFRLSPRFRVNDRLAFTTSVNMRTEHDDVGYVSDSEEQINFGLRDLNTFTNTLTTKYTFNNRMDLFFRMRHYWSTAEYTDFFELTDKGKLAKSNYHDEHDRNFNAFNIDMVYTWTFAPASEVSIVWKNAILTDANALQEGYFNNFSEVMAAPQTNSLSIRILYLLDYSMLMKARKNQKIDNPLLAGGYNHPFSRS